MRVVKVDINNYVIEEKNVLDGYELKNKEFQSDNGEVGQILQPDGSFLTPEIVVVPTETLEQKIERLEQQIRNDNLVQFEVLATIYEELITKGSV